MRERTMSHVKQLRIHEAIAWESDGARTPNRKRLNGSSRNATRANKQQACLVQTYTQAAEATTNHE